MLNAVKYVCFSIKKHLFSQHVMLLRKRTETNVFLLHFSLVRVVCSLKIPKSDVKCLDAKLFHPMDTVHLSWRAGHKPAISTRRKYISMPLWV